MNFSEGLVSDSTRRFHTASPASKAPGRSPMRGSGVGGIADTFAAVFTEVRLLDRTGDDAHPTTAKTTAASTAGKNESTSEREWRGNGCLNPTLCSPERGRPQGSKIRALSLPARINILDSSP